MEYSTEGQSAQELRVLSRLDRKRERQRRRVLADIEARRKYERPDAAEQDERDLDRADAVAAGVLTLGLAPLFGVMAGVRAVAEPVGRRPVKAGPTPVRVVNRW